MKKPNSVCKQCQYKQAISGRNSCVFGKKEMCPQYLAVIAENALEDKETAAHISVESLLKALRFHGFTGELRKSQIVII